MSEEINFTWPWEAPTEPTIEQHVEALRQDFAYAVLNTCIVVHSSNPALKMAANTARGQLIPRNECQFKDGTTLELQDIGMCQPNLPYMTVAEIMSKVLETAATLGLELK